MIDSVRFMTSSFSNLTDNPAEEIHKIKCRFGHGNEKCQTCGIKYKDCECFLDYENVKYDSIQ